MKKLLLSTAMLALLAAPAFAQRQDGNPPHAMSERSGRDHGGMDRMRGPQQPRQQQQIAPQPQTNTDAMRGNGRGGRDGNPGPSPQAQQTPQAQPQQPNAMAMRRGDRDNDRNRGGNNWNNGQRGGNDRFDNDRRDNRGWDNRRGDNRPRADFRRYQRNFAAPQRFRAPAYRRPAGWYSHRWTFGEILPAAFFGRSYWIDNFTSFGLMDPPYGTVWVRYGSDALLIDRYTGEVIQVAYRVFY